MHRLSGELCHISTGVPSHTIWETSPPGEQSCEQSLRGSGEGAAGNAGWAGKGTGRKAELQAQGMGTAPQALRGEGQGTGSALTGQGKLQSQIQVDKAEQAGQGRRGSTDIF